MPQKKKTSRMSEPLILHAERVLEITLTDHRDSMYRLEFIVLAGGSTRWRWRKEPDAEWSEWRKTSNASLAAFDVLTEFDLFRQHFVLLYDILMKLDK